MTSSLLLTIAMLFSFAQVGDADRYPSQTTDPVVEGWVAVADHVRLPAREAGVLVHLAVKEGSQVRAGQEIGKIDDSEPQMQKKASGYALNAAVKRFQDDIEIQYAAKQADVAEADYEQLREANRRVDGAVTVTDVRRAKLDWDRAILAIQKAKHEQELARLDAYVRKAEVDAAEMAIQRRLILAPFDGVVEKLERKQDEWVNPGDMILWLVRMDAMHVDVAIDQSQYDPHEIDGCEVTVEVEMARGRKETFRGRITKVSSVVRGDDLFDVRAEVANRQEQGSWVLRDRLPATMTIHLGTGGTAATGVTRVP